MFRNARAAIAVLVGASAGMVAAQTPPTAPAPAGAPAPVPIRAQKVILVGDSTSAVIGGWGPAFCGWHVTSFAACVNLARGGRSSGSYIAEGSWDLALAEMKTPGFTNTYVLIQFGHNDQPGKPGRSTDLETEFPRNIERYVTETRAAGAVPVLLTPLTRRMFKDGKVDNDLEPWAQKIRDVAARLKVPLVDLNRESVAAVQALGPTLANRFAQRPPSNPVADGALEGKTLPADFGTVPPAPAGAAPSAAQANAAVEPLGQARLSFDYTHLGVEGANFFAAMVTRELARNVPAMRPFLVMSSF